MTVTVTPTLSVGGEVVSLSAIGAPGLVAIEELSVPWGRAAVLEDTVPATAALTLLDRSAARTFAGRVDLVGLEVIVGWSASDGMTGTIFRGRITDADVYPPPGAVIGRGFTVDLACSSLEVDLASHTVAAGTVWPQETHQARRLRLAALLPAAVAPGGVVLPDRFDLAMQYDIEPASDLELLPAAAVDVSGRDLLSLVRELYASTSPLPATFDPATRGFTFPGRRVHNYGQQGLTMSAALTAAADRGGRYVPASLAGLRLDAGLVGAAGSLGQRLDNRISQVEVTYLDAAAGGATRTATASTTYTAGEATTGRRTLRVDSWHTTAANAGQLARIYADFINGEARLPRLGVLDFRDDVSPFPTSAHAALLLAGRERSDRLFLGGSWLPQVASRPLVGVLGGTVGYAAGRWSVRFTPAPVLVEPGAARSWGPVTVAAAATPTVTLADLDPTVTFGDMGFIDVGAGFDTSTALPYKGNPL